MFASPATATLMSTRLPALPPVQKRRVSTSRSHMVFHDQQAIETSPSTQQQLSTASGYSGKANLSPSISDALIEKPNDMNFSPLLNALSSDAASSPGRKKKTTRSLAKTTTAGSSGDTPVLPRASPKDAAVGESEGGSDRRSTGEPWRSSSPSTPRKEFGFAAKGDTSAMHSSALLVERHDATNGLALFGTQNSINEGAMSCVSENDTDEEAATASDLVVRRERRGDPLSPLRGSPKPLTATETQAPVVREPLGIRCCPLLEQRITLQRGPGWSPDDAKSSPENMSPFQGQNFIPYLAPMEDRRQTLVLDMDETLLHTSVEYMPDADAVLTVYTSNTGGSEELTAVVEDPSLSFYVLYLKYRPYLHDFLKFCVAHFEVVIFTAGKEYYARAVLHQLQNDFPFVRMRVVGNAKNGSAIRAGSDVPHSNVIRVLHRDHCTPTNIGYAKDLHLLGRSICRTILIDNNEVCGVFQPYNFIHVKDFARRRSVNDSREQSSMSDALARLKGGMGPAPEETTARASPSLNMSTLEWMDADDQVLRHLCDKSGLLAFLAECNDVPRYLSRMMQYNSGSK